jgi:hypothetical protein
MGLDCLAVVQPGMSIFSPLVAADNSIIDLAAGKVRDLYNRMSSAYDNAAACYGFSCSGCDENCCEERFYHHSLSEFLYLFRGLESLDEKSRQGVFIRARDVLQLYRIHDAEGMVRRVICPLNIDGLCSLYDYRLMICRLHGVPYKMRMPDGTETQGAGCHKLNWDMSSEKNAACMFDRTDLYRELSGIEIELRQKLGFGHRIKKTIAEMITDIDELFFYNQTMTDL